jgi:hypothetical protein
MRLDLRATEPSVTVCRRSSEPVPGMAGTSVAAGNLRSSLQPSLQPAMHRHPPEGLRIIRFAVDAKARVVDSNEAADDDVIGLAGPSRCLRFVGSQSPVTGFRIGDLVNDAGTLGPASAAAGCGGCEPRKTFALGRFAFVRKGHGGLFSASVVAPEVGCRGHGSHCPKDIDGHRGADDQPKVHSP